MLPILPGTLSQFTISLSAPRNYLLKMVIELDRPGGLRDNPRYDSRPAAPAKGVEANARRTVHESMARSTLSVGRNVGREGS